MVHGLTLFKDFFSGYEDQYILIGGSACDIYIEEQGGDFRATKDLDLVLVTEALSTEFVDRFWEFVKLGGYETIRKSDGTRTFYRFDKPNNRNYPAMLEILSTDGDVLKDVSDSCIMRLKVEDEVVSLSAILLNAQYYKFIHEKKIIIEGVSLVGVNCLIPLKMRAWLDLKSKKEQDSSIRSSDIRKHMRDVLRLEGYLPRTVIEDVPEIVKEDVKAYSKEILKQDIRLRDLGIIDRNLEEIVEHLKNSYNV